MGSSKLSKSKKAQAEPVETKPLKFLKKDKSSFGLSAPAMFKPVDKKVDKINALFSGAKNPFLAKPKFNKTLIATPSKFEIRNEPEVSEKKRRGRPKKDD